MAQFENAFQGRFTLFNVKEKKNPKSPDKSGTLEITLEEAMKLADWLTAQSGEPNYQGEQVVKIRLSAWNATSKDSGLAYINGIASAEKTSSSNERMPF